jgi:hypothetical protein
VFSLLFQAKEKKRTPHARSTLTQTQTIPILIRFIISACFHVVTFGFDVSPLVGWPNTRSHFSAECGVSSMSRLSVGRAIETDDDVRHLTSRAESCVFGDECPIDEARELLYQMMTVQS